MQPIQQMTRLGRGIHNCLVALSLLINGKCTTKETVPEMFHTRHVVAHVSIANRAKITEMKVDPYMLCFDLAKRRKWRRAVDTPHTKTNDPALTLNDGDRQTVHTYRIEQARRYD